MGFRKKVGSKLHHLAGLATFPLHANPLQRRNCDSHESVIDASGPVVSLTTFGARERDAYLAIESIARGSEKPSRLIVWLDDRTDHTAYPESLKRLERRGLEVRFTQDFGPHKKYFPYIMSEFDDSLPLVTADDDTIYPRSWLKALTNAHHREPDTIHCHRARRIIFRHEGKLANYADWPLCKSSEASFLHFSTGVSGAIYPLRILHALRSSGASFTELCPRADDVWLHWHAVRENCRTRQISSRAREFPYLATTQVQSLTQTNVHEGNNDMQIRKVYSSDDLRHMYEEIPKLL